MSEIQLRTTVLMQGGGLTRVGTHHDFTSDVDTLLSALQSATAENERLRGLVEGVIQNRKCACNELESGGGLCWICAVAAALSRTQEGVGE